MRLYVRTSRDTKCERGAGGVCTCDADERCGPATRDVCAWQVCTDALHASLSWGGDTRPGVILVWPLFPAKSSAPKQTIPSREGCPEG